MKFPAAPALLFRFSSAVCTWILQVEGEWCLHDIINASQLFHTSLDRTIHILNLPHINIAHAYHLGSGAQSRHLCGHGLGFGRVSTDDEGIRTEVNEGLYLDGADCTCATGTKDDLVI